MCTVSECGAPVNHLDKVCRTIQWWLECLRLDYDNDDCVCINLTFFPIRTIRNEKKRLKLRTDIDLIRIDNHAPSEKREKYQRNKANPIGIDCRSNRQIICDFNVSFHFGTRKKKPNE